MISKIFTNFWDKVTNINPNLLVFSFVWAFFVLLFLYVYPISRDFSGNEGFVYWFNNYLSNIPSYTIFFSNAIGVIVVLILEVFFVKNKKTASYKWTIAWGIILVFNMWLLLSFVGVNTTCNKTAFIICFIAYAISIMFLHYSYSIEKVETKKLKSNRSLKKAVIIQQQNN